MPVRINFDVDRNWRPADAALVAEQARCADVRVDQIGAAKAAVDCAKQAMGGAAVNHTANEDQTFVGRLWTALEAARQPTSAVSGTLPLPRLTTTWEASSAYYVVSSVDARGRLADRSPLRVLGWRPDHPIAISVVAGVVVVTATPDGPNTVTRQGCLRLPVSVRHMIRLAAGDRALVAALADRDFLVVYPMRAVDAMVLAFHVHQSSQDAA